MKTLAMRATSTAAIAVLTWLAPSTQAAAHMSDNASTALSRQVFYGDLDLQSEAGVARLHTRIARAAKWVCGGMSQTFLQETQWRKQCRTLAIADAIERVNQPLLTRYHTGKNLFAAR